MSRQEDFIEAGIAYRMKHSKPMCIAGSNLADVERDFNRVMSFEAGAEHGYQYALQHPHWIPVEERLPKEENLYIVSNGKDTSVAYWVDDSWDTFGDVITHWMPLPAAPVTHWMEIVPPRKEEKE